VSTDVQGPPPEASESRDIAAEVALSPPDVIADSLGEYAKIWITRVRNGDSGALPVILGLVVIVIYFQARSSLFLSAGNLVNLAGQAAWIAVLVGLAVPAIFSGLEGLITTRLRLPSFVVTLAGQLLAFGLLLEVMDTAAPSGGGTIRLYPGVLADIYSGSVSPVAGWIVMAAAVAGAAALFLVRDSRRRASNLTAPPLSVTLLKIAAIAVAGVVVVLVGNTNRGVGFTVVRGVPWVVLVVVVVVFAWSVLLSRTRFGRYIYAIGGNAEAARRAGISLTRIRVLAFTLCGLTAGVMGIIYTSYLGSVSTDVQGGQLVLLAVAAAVIGGVSLFGGRGKMVGALLGGLIVAVIYNGLELLGLGTAPQYIWTAVVLLAAVTVDTLARRRSTTA